MFSGAKICDKFAIYESRKNTGFIPEAIALIPYLDLEQSMDRDIMLRNHIVWYAQEEWGVGRIDDFGAAKITVKTSSDSGVGG